MAYRGISAAALVLVLCASCELPTVPSESPAYEPSLFVDFQTRLIYHWPLGRTISIYTGIAGGSADDDLRAAILSAAAGWNRAVYYREFDIRLVNSPLDADVIFHLDVAPPIVDTNSCEGILLGAGGVTYFCVDEGLTAILSLPLAGSSSAQSRVKFDVTISSDPLQVPTRERFFGIVAHEMGHVLGIASHSSDSADLMFTAPSISQPSARDARTLRWLLHQPSDLDL
ncbi:MAG: hypothetical protein H7Z74_04050 [Anaerolineae bacterium]|nr:hypothetical protein [Gemmatimonadaceae bacterium]